MRPHFSEDRLARLEPAASAVASHVRRVAALSTEIGQRMAHPIRQAALEQAALLHHTPELLLNAPALDRLLADVLPARPNPLPAPKSIPPPLPLEVRATLHAFHRVIHAEPADEIRRMAEVLTLGNLLDEQLEWLAFDPRPMSRIWAELQELRGLFRTEVLEAARRALAVPFHPAASDGWGLPVQALAAKAVVRAVAGSGDCDIPALAALAGRDPVLAGRLLQAANSALYARQSPARSILQAISFIGVDATRKLLMALALQPLFASAELAGLWRHSVWMAGFCEGLALASGWIHPEQALLLGLVHDIGTIALQNQHREGLPTYARMAEKGCPAAYIERLLFGRDHAEIGAAILGSWQFPEDMVETVRFHHRPADGRSAGASFLHIAEFYSNRQEDLPSSWQLDGAFTRTACSPDMLARAHSFQSPLVDLLRVA